MTWNQYAGYAAVENYLRRYEIALEVEFVSRRPVERVAAEPDHDDSLDDGGVFQNRRSYVSKRTDSYHVERVSGVGLGD